MQSRFAFLEGDLVVDGVGEASADLDTSGGPARVIARVELGPKGAGVDEHWVVSVTSTASVGDHGDPMQHVHPRFFEIEVPIPGGADETIILDRRKAETMGPSGVVTLPDGRLLGLRDANMREPAAIILRPDSVVIRCLDDRPPTVGYLPWVGAWQSALTGRPDEDPLSDTHHTLPGGRMALPWHILVVQPEARIRIEMEEPPAVDPAWLEFAGILPPALRAKRSPRHAACLDAITRVGVRTKPGVGHVFSDNGPIASFVRMWTQGEARFTYEPHPHIGDVFDLTHGSEQHLHWLSWPDVFWNDGHSNLHYDAAYVFWRHWMENPDEPWRWWICLRLIEHAATAGLCWSKGGGGLRKYEGWCWYEKSTRGPSRVYQGAYAGYPVARYKQWTKNLAAAAMSFSGIGWAERGWSMHTKALRRMGFETWDGNWGARAVATGMRSHVAAFRAGAGDIHRQLAVQSALQAITITKEPGRIGGESNPKWADPDLGVPYWLNPMAMISSETNWFEMFKVPSAMAEVATFCATATERALIEKKIAQCVDFWIEAGFELSNGWAIPRYKLTADRVPAIYNGGEITINTGFRALDWGNPRHIEPGSVDHSVFTEAWSISALTYAASAMNHAGARIMLRTIGRHYGETMDRVPMARYGHWTGDVTDRTATTVTVTGSLAGVPSNVGIRFSLAHPTNGGEQDHAVVKVASVAGQVIACVVPTKVVNHGGPIKYGITGPIIQWVKTAVDLAVKPVEIIGHSPKPITGPCDWHDGQDFNAQLKKRMPMLLHGDLMAIVTDFLDQLGVPQ